MKKSILQGITAGLIFTLLINAICRVTFYGLEYGIASSIDVFYINLIFIIVSALIVWLLKKLKIKNKITLASNIILILFGILIFVSVFYEKISGIVTINYILPGPTVKIPNILWLIVLICVTTRNICTDENEKHKLLKFTIGELISVVILSIFDLGLDMFINYPLDNAMNINILINGVIKGVCGILIIVKSIYMARKCLDSKNENKCVKES